MFKANVFPAIVFLCCAVCTTNLSAQEKPQDETTDSLTATKDSHDPQLKMSVEALVAQLDADSLIDRRNAQEELIAMGVEILSLLDDIESPGGEATKRLVTIRNALQLEAIEKSTESTLVTIEGEMSIADAFAKISEQTGNTIIGVEDRPEMIGVAFDKEPFWKAMDKMLDNTGMTIDDYGGEGKAIRIIPRGLSPDRHEKAIYNSIFRISNSRISLTRNLENPELDLFRATVKIAWEPRLQPISIGIPVESLRIRDDVGDNIEVARESGTISTSIENQPTIELTLPVKLPNPDAEYVNIEGKLEAVLPGRKESFEFANLLDGKEKEVRHGQATVTLESFTKNNDLHHARIRVRFQDAEDSLESHRGWIYGNEAVLVKENGTEVEKIHVDLYRQTANDIGFRYMFDVQEIPDGMKLIYHSPAAVVTLPIDFELKKIVLP